MTIRQYAKAVGFEIIGKLEKHVKTVKGFDYSTGRDINEKIVYYTDRAGNEYINENGNCCIIPADSAAVI